MIIFLVISFWIGIWVFPTLVAIIALIFIVSGAMCQDGKILMIIGIFLIIFLCASMATIFSVFCFMDPDTIHEIKIEKDGVKYHKRGITTRGLEINIEATETSCN